MNFDDLASRAARAAVAAGVRARRPEFTVVRSARRRRSAGSAVVGAFVVTMLLVGGAAWWPAGTPGVPTSSVAAADPVATTATTRPSTTAPAVSSTTIAPATSTAIPNFAGRIWSIAEPASWHRANSELMPNLTWTSMTLATFPLHAGGAGCAHMPETALRDLGPQDVLLTIFFTGAAGEAAPWPGDGFSDDVFSASAGTDAHECAALPDLEVHWDSWENDGEILQLLVALGADVPDAVRQEAWTALSSLQSIDNSGTGRICVVTVPPEPGLTVPDSHPQEPVFGRWYGTIDLWTVLETDGSYGPRKSVWWSVNFPGGTIEEQPDVSVTWRRLDRDRPLLANDSTATNAYTAEDGWFMIAGIDPEEGGCWEVTATYKDATLSYVAAIR